MTAKNMTKCRNQSNHLVKSCLMTTAMLVGTALATNLAQAQEHTFDLKVVVGEPMAGDEDKTIVGVNNFFLLNDGGVIIDGALSVTPAASEFALTAIFGLSPTGQFSSIVKTTDTYLVDGGPRKAGIGNFGIRPHDIFVNRDTGLVTFEVFFGDITYTASAGQALTPVLNDYFIPPLNPPIEPALLPNSHVAAMNNEGQFLIRIDSSPNGPSPNFPIGALFLGQPGGSFSTIAKIEDVAPGIPGGSTFSAFFTERGNELIDFLKDGSVFFNAQHTPDNFSGFDSFWRSTGGGPSLIAYEDMPTPGITGGTLIDLKLAQPINSTDAIIFGDILPQGITGNDSFSNGLWVGSSPASLTPIALVVPDARLTNKINTLGKTAFFAEIELLPLLSTLTNLGNITFLDLDAPVIGPSGTLYFTGTGRLDDTIGGVRLDNEIVEGIWKWDPVKGDVSLAVETSFFLNTDSLEFQSAFPLLVDSLGGLVFNTVAKGDNSNNPDKPLWYLSNEGSVVNITSPGDMINGMVVVEAEALHFNDNDILATKTLFEDFTGDGVDDQTILAVTLDIPPAEGTEFLWTGDAKDDDWHKALNWDDKATDKDATIAPGDPDNGGSDHTVHIEDAIVRIDDSPVSVNSLDASGSLSVNQPLTIDAQSSIESLELLSDLTLFDDLMLTGNPEMKQGDISGVGALNFESSATGTWMPTALGGSALQKVEVEMNVFGTLLHGDDVVVDIQDAGFLNIKEGGTYRAARGNISNSSSNTFNPMTNAGYLEIVGTGDDVFTLDTEMINEGGTIAVETGELHLATYVDFEGGELKVNTGGKLVFDRKETSPGTVVSEDLNASGQGGIEFQGNKFFIEDGKKAIFNMSLAGNGLLIDDGAEIDGINEILGGTLINEGRMVFQNGILKTTFENEGTLVIMPPTDISTILIENTQLVNRKLVLQKGSISIIRSSELAPKTAIDNQGSWQLEDGSEIIGPPDSTHFLNTANGILKMVKDGIANIRIPFKNEGTVHVTKGKLIFQDNTTWDTQSIGTIPMRIESGSSLELSASNDQDTTHINNTDLELTGGGLLVLKHRTFDFGFQNTLSNKGSEIHIHTGTQFTLGELWNQKGTITFLMAESGFKSLRWTGSIRNDSNQLIKLPSNTTIQMDRPGSMILNSGDFIVSGPLENPNILIATDGIEPRAQFINEGLFSIDNSPNPLGHITQIDATFEASKDRLNGIVEVKSNTWLNLINPGEETIIDEQGEPIKLIAGEWILHPKGTLSFGPRGISGIGKFAHVTLMGISNDDAVKDGTIAGMPGSFSDFVNDGYLALKDAEFSTNKGNFENNGTLSFRPGRIHVIAADNTVGVFKNNGTILGYPVIDVTSFKNLKIIDMGESPGSMTINGNFTQEPGGILIMEVAGTGSAGTDYDQLIVNGIATLGGTLLLEEIDGFEWLDTVPVPVVHATTFVGAFDQVVFSSNTSRRITSPEIVDDMLSVTATTITPATFNDWRNAHFSEADQANEEISGLLADPDGDLSTNLLEYAFDGIPNFKDTQTVLSEITPNEAGDKLRVTVQFPWAHGMTDVKYTLQTSPDLENWTDLEITLTNTEPGEYADILTAEAEIDTAGNIPVYGRLLVKEIEL